MLHVLSSECKPGSPKREEASVPRYTGGSWLVEGVLLQKTFLAATENNGDSECVLRLCVGICFCTFYNRCDLGRVRPLSEPNQLAVTPPRKLTFR